MARYRQSHPGVDVVLHEMQPSLQQAALRDKRIDVGISRTAVNDDQLASTLLWPDPVVAALPPGHPLAQKERISLDDIAHESLITYHPSFTGRNKINEAFMGRGLKPNVVLTAIDSGDFVPRAELECSLERERGATKLHAADVEQWTIAANAARAGRGQRRPRSRAIPSCSVDSPMPPSRSSVETTPRCSRTTEAMPSPARSSPSTPSPPARRAPFPCTGSCRRQP